MKQSNVATPVTAVTQTEGSHTWSITDPMMLRKIVNAKNGQQYKSGHFKMANLDWRIEIKPNGMSRANIGSFDVFLKLLHRPSQWQEIIIAFTIQSPQTKSSYMDLTTYKEGEMSPGWSDFSLSLKEVKQRHLKKLILKVTIKIIRVTLNDNIIHYQSSYHYKSKQTMTHCMNEDAVKSFKKCNFGKSYCSPVINQMYAIGIFPNGVGADIGTKGQCWVYFKLCALSENVTRMKIKFTVCSEELDFKRVKTKDFSMDKTESAVCIGSFADFQLLSDLSITIDVEIMKQDDFNGKEISIPIFDPNYVTDVLGLHALFIADQRKEAYSKLRLLTKNFNEILQDAQAEYKDDEQKEEEAKITDLECIIQSLTDRISTLQQSHQSTVAELSTKYQNQIQSLQLHITENAQKAEHEITEKNKIIKTQKTAISSMVTNISTLEQQQRATAGTIQQYQSQVETLQNDVLQNAQKFQREKLGHNEALEEKQSIIKSLENQNKVLQHQLSTINKNHERKISELQDVIQSSQQQKKTERITFQQQLSGSKRDNISKAQQIQQLKQDKILIQDKLKESQNETQSLQSLLLKTTQKAAEDTSNKEKLIETQQAKIMALENEIAAMKQQQIEEEEKKQDEDENIDLRNELLSITDNIKEFNGKYNLEAISSIYKDDSDRLPDDTELDNADILCKSMIKQLQGMKEYIHEQTKIDMRAYKSWDIDKTMKWIKGLDQGRYGNYLDVLRKGFISDGIGAADLPYIGQHDLSTDPFSIRSFGDRKRLAEHFKSLMEFETPMNKNKTVDTTNDKNDEGTITEYHMH